jgi:uncharacterized protein (DUF433 family)
MELAIINRGRGPEIAGSRITVYDVLAESQAGATVEEMAGWWQLTVEQIQFALRYIEEYREEVEKDWAAIKARIARGNPPHIQKLIDETHARMAPIFEEFRKGNRRPLEEFLAERRRLQEQEHGDDAVSPNHVVSAATIASTS